MILDAVLSFALELELPLAGHGYDVGTPTPVGESDGDDAGGGIGTTWVAAVLLLTLVTTAVLLWLNPSALGKLRTHAAKAVILVVIAAPLVAWTVSSLGGDQDLDDIFVERWAAGLDGAPELVVSLGNKAMNTLEFTDGKRVVRVECFDRDGGIVLAGEHKWPFVFDDGYDYAHAHQRATRNQLEQIARCRLVGVRERLEAGVRGALK